MRVLRNNHEWAGIPLPSTPVATSSSAVDTSGDKAKVDTLRIKSLASKAIGMDDLRRAAANRLVKAGVSLIALGTRSYTGGGTHAFKFGHESAGQHILERGSNCMRCTGAVEKDKDPPMVRMSSLHEQAGEDEDIYQKVPCWCKTADKDTTKAIEDAQFQISDLTGSFEENTAMSATYATDIESKQKELEGEKRRLAEATALREKQLGASMRTKRTI